MANNSDLVKSLKVDVLKTPRIIQAFEAVDRKDFVLEEQHSYAYVDEPLPIGFGQTISQPWTVAFMTEALEPTPGQKILEIGTGSGYQAAILSKIVGSAGKVITIECIPKLFQYSSSKLANYKNVTQVQGDGSKGHSSEAPYDRIIVTAAAPKIPIALFAQLKERGILLSPVGGSPIVLRSLKPMGKGKLLYAPSPSNQRMLRIRKFGGKMKIEDLGGFVFVPLLGKHGFKQQ